MYNFIRKLKIIPVLIALCIAVGCSGGSVKLETIDKSYSTDTVYADVKIPQLSGLSSESLQKNVNDEYTKTITELLNTFSENAKKTGDKSVFEAETTIHYNRAGFFSVVTQIDSCTGSVHKNSYRITKNIDTEQCVELKLSDIFADDAYIDMLNSRIEEEIKLNSDKYSDLWEKPSISQNQRFYINDKFLVLFYAPYELSYYERGFVEIPLSIADMSGYLKPEYRNLAGG